MTGGRIVAGTRAVAEALRSQSSQVDLILIERDAGRGAQALVEEARKRRVPVQERDRRSLDRFAEGLRHQGIVAVAGPYPYVDLEALLASAADPPLLVALDQVTDPHNFGAIVRTAVALGVDGLITLKDRAAPVTAAVVRASAGSTEHARIARVTNLARTLATLRDRGLSVVGLAADGPVGVASLPSASEGRVLVVGSEGRGLRRLVREGCDVVARIDLPGPIASLNASVAAAIALYEAARLRREADPSGRG